MTEHQRQIVNHNLRRLTAWQEMKRSKHNPVACNAYEACGPYRSLKAEGVSHRK